MRAAVKGTGDSQVPGLRNKQGICRGSKMLQAAPLFPCWSHAALRAAGLWAPTCSTAGAEHVEAQAQLQDSAPGLKFSLRAFAQLSPLETSPEGARAGDTFDVTATFRSGREQGGVLALVSRSTFGAAVVHRSAVSSHVASAVFDWLGLMPALL